LLTRKLNKHRFLVNNNLRPFKRALSAELARTGQSSSSPTLIRQLESADVPKKIPSNFDGKKQYEYNEMDSARLSKSTQKELGKSTAARPLIPSIGRLSMAKATSSKPAVDRRAQELDTIADVLPLERRDELAELLSDQDVETLRYLVNEGMGDNTLRALTSNLAHMQRGRWHQRAIPFPGRRRKHCSSNSSRITCGNHSNAMSIRITACRRTSSRACANNVS
jgi:hypothetical protein